MVVAPRQERLARRGAERGGVKARVLEAARRQPLGVRRLAGAAEGAGGAEPLRTREASGSAAARPAKWTIEPVLHRWQDRITMAAVKSVTVRLPEALVAEIEAESRERRRSKSDVVRERLSLAARPRRRRGSADAIADLVGSVDGLPADLSAQKKAYLRTTSYGRKRPR